MCLRIRPAPISSAPIAIEHGNDMQSPLLNELCLLLAESLTVRGYEVRHEDEAPQRIPPREASYVLLWCVRKLHKEPQTSGAH